MGAKSHRAAEDVAQLDRAISSCVGDELHTFNAWRDRLVSGALSELGAMRRAYVRNFLQAGMGTEKKSIPKPADSGVILCGPLPAYPPGMTVNSRRFGEGRR